MFKALQNDRLIAISDNDSFPCLVYDEIVEDTEHVLNDYTVHNGDIMLKSEVPAPTREEQEANRKAAYENEVDELHSQKLRHEVLGDWTEEDEAEYRAKVIQLSQEIAERYPYPVEE